VLGLGRGNTWTVTETEKKFTAVYCSPPYYGCLCYNIDSRSMEDCELPNTMKQKDHECKYTRQPDHQKGVDKKSTSVAAVVHYVCDERHCVSAPRLHVAEYECRCCYLSVIVYSWRPPVTGSGHSSRSAHQLKCQKPDLVFNLHRNAFSFQFGLNSRWQMTPSVVGFQWASGLTVDSLNTVTDSIIQPTVRTCNQGFREKPRKSK